VDGASVAGLFFRLALSLTVVIGLMVGIAAVLRRRGFGGFAPAMRKSQGVANQVEVLARKPLGRNASIAVVRAGNKSMVLGVTESHVTMLAEAELDDIEEIELQAAPAQRTGPPIAALNGGAPTWKTMLESLRDKTVRR
jgi:flagellar biosynthetic protein FliO